MRIPLGGVSVHSYDNQLRGQLCKGANILLRVTLVVLGALLIAKVFPVAYVPQAIIPLSLLTFSLFLAGSNSKRKALEVFFELAIAAVSLTMVFLAVYGTLTYGQAGIGILAGVAGGILVGIGVDRGGIQQTHHDEMAFSSNGDSKLLSEEGLKKVTPPLPVKVIDYGVGVTRDAKISTISIVSGLVNRSHYKPQIPHDEKAKGLCVLLHGLESRPGVLDGYHSALSSHYEENEVAIFQPHVEKNGKCPLDEAVLPILEEVQKWAVAFPGKPIVWIGHSNGARIAAEVSARLQQSGYANPMQVHCIAGPFNGTTFVNRPDWPNRLKKGWGTVFKKMYSEAVYEELSWESTRGAQLIGTMQSAAQTYPNLNYRFYSTPSDAVVTPFVSAFPQVANGSYHVSHAEGHQGILSAVEGAIVENAVEFIG